MSLQKGKILDLRMDRGFKDSTPYENHGTATDVTLGADRKGNTKAGVFNGTSSYIDCGNDSSLTIADNITISLWFKNEYTPPTYSAYLCRYQTFGGKRIWAVSYTNGIVSYWSKNGLSGIGTSAINVENGVWYNFVCTFESGIVKQYLNGELKTTDDISASVDSLYETSTRLVIGARDEGLDFYMNGSIERPQIWNRALSADEVKLLFSSYNPCLMIVKGGIG